LNSGSTRLPHLAAKATMTQRGDLWRASATESSRVTARPFKRNL
jgi:hypothetical protein